MLQLRCHDVIIANDGNAALVRACETVPALVFLDIGMPGLTGFEVARALRANPAYDQMVLVALTGWGTKEDQQRTKEAGFNYHLTKPIHLAAVDKLLQSVVAGVSGKSELVKE